MKHFVQVFNNLIATGLVIVTGEPYAGKSFLVKALTDGKDITVVDNYEQYTPEELSVVEDAFINAGKKFVLITGDEHGHEKRLPKLLGKLVANASVAVPPLRQRVNDIPGLVRYYLFVMFRKYGVKISISDRAIETLQKQDWPNNCLGLEFTLAYAAKAAPVITEHNIFVPIRRNMQHQLEAVLKDHYTYVYKLFRGDRAMMMSALGVSRPTLLKHIRSYGLE